MAIAFASCFRHLSLMSAIEHPLSSQQLVSLPLIDPFQRRVTYLRLSVTDRCDLRCVYCMSETMQFLPKRDVLSFEELQRLCTVFIDLGVTKLRITGGEPLMRRDVMRLFHFLSCRLKAGELEEVTLTTNGTRLALHAQELADCGVRRINVSLDTLDPASYRRITRGGDLEKTLEGIKAAQKAGLVVKINAVALRETHEEDIPRLIDWSHSQNMALTLIEVMPMGDTGIARPEQFVSLRDIREKLERHWTLSSLAVRTNGPARYVHVKETGGVLGFITPLSDHFCETCNRVRLTCTGQLYLCLGQEDKVDLRHVLRQSSGNQYLRDAVIGAIARKPLGHNFGLGTLGAPARHMSMTGG
jgi:GTP 3',8-cyclase